MASFLFGRGVYADSSIWCMY